MSSGVPRYPLSGRPVFGDPASDLSSREAQMAVVIRNLVGENDALKAHIRDVEKTAGIYAAVIEVREHRIVVHSGDQMGDYEKAPYLQGLERGDLVRLSKDGQILAVEKDPPAIGPIFKVTGKKGGFAVVDDGRVVIDKKGTAEVGSEVLLDMSRTVIVRDLGRPPSKLAFTEKTGVSWDDIGGQEEAKRQIREAVEGPVLHADLYREFGLTVPKGILLYGPPGCGKTMVAKAIATSVADLTGHAAAASGFIYVKGPEVINKYVGESEAGVRALFEAARAHFSEHHYPAVVCIDEADALVGARKDSNLTLEKTIVPQFLAEMDGLDASGALVLLLTNRPDTLDPAVVRDGRVDLKIKIGRPTREEAEELLRKALSKRLIARECVMRGELAHETAARIWDARAGIAMVRVKSGQDRRVELSDVVSGAMLVGIVDRATKKALRRAQEGGAHRGVTAEDLAEAVKETPSQIKGLNLSMELSDIVAEVGGYHNVTRIEAAP